MLSYNHAYHAGAVSDILKHTVLTLALERIRQKNTSFTVIDTHAGQWTYSLNDKRLLHTKEASEGIEKLFAFYKDSSSFVTNPYLNFVKDFVRNALYPGSPCIAHSFLRRGDTHILCELHSTTFAILQSNAPPDIKLYFKDGFRSLLSFLPPKTNRGLVLIDPSYEDESDYATCIECTQKAIRKWANGVYIIWYPLLKRRGDSIAMLKERISYIASMNSVSHTVLCAEFCNKDTESASEFGLYGSGTLVINPTYMLEEKLKQILPQYALALSCNATFSVKYLSKN